LDSRSRGMGLARQILSLRKNRAYKDNLTSHEVGVPDIALQMVSVS